jgi:outer membrane protein assembly factor BamA
MEASVQISPQMDDGHSTVHYLLQVHEGDVYKMGDLDIQGLDSRTTARLVDSWKLNGSDTYDSGYLKKFLQQSLKDLEANGGWKVSIHETVNEKDKTVDVTLRFDPK